MIPPSQRSGEEGKQKIKSLAARKREQIPEIIPTYLMPPYDDIEYCIKLANEFQESYNDLQKSGWGK